MSSWLLVMVMYCPIYSSSGSETTVSRELVWSAKNCPTETNFGAKSNSMLVALRLTNPDTLVQLPIASAAAALQPKLVQFTLPWKAFLSAMGCEQRPNHEIDIVFIAQETAFSQRLLSLANLRWRGWPVRRRPPHRLQ